MWHTFADSAFQTLRTFMKRQTVSPDARDTSMGEFVQATVPFCITHFTRNNAVGKAGFETMQKRGMHVHCAVVTYSLQFQKETRERLKKADREACFD